MTLIVGKLPLSLVAKKFENRLIFGEVVGKSLVSCFFLTRDVDVEQAIFAAGCSMKVQCTGHQSPHCST